MPVGDACQKHVCESMQDLIRIPKDLLPKTHPVEVWPGSQGNDREAKLHPG